MKEITGKLKGLKFGDIVENHWASEDNPSRFGVYVRSNKETITLTNMKGRFWNLYNDKNSSSVIVGSIFKDQLPTLEDVLKECGE